MKGYVVLETGEQFEGELFGAEKEKDVHAEIVFFTGMTGYQEVLSDPSFKGQMVVFTYPLIGNYGINDSDFESLKPQVEALIISELNGAGHHYEANQPLAGCLQHAQVPYITGVDTRAIVKRIRKNGDMRAVLTTHPESVDFSATTPLGEQEVVSSVSVQAAETFGHGERHVVLLDFGYKKSIVSELVDQGNRVTVVPYSISFEEVVSLKPDGILLSNGPGNPKQLETRLPVIRKLAETYPTLGICLGHQLLALAFGGDTEKLNFGHRGANQPVIDQETNKVYMTSQNHSYVVKETSLTDTSLHARFFNINDGSIEGLEHKRLPVLSVQFHPEAHPGPSDSAQLFNLFKEMMSQGRESLYV
ncbi:carbamoyl phosphate synthase small subunit [Alkalicoccobacillus murimartini]|uniref:Carbamoyl phosphate synthase small chain n=1 Tax=Alkalicoccobacillus murimartini TaxID=171685 RepID=A0ABT9YJ92_9BACI|nr:carbamoyl phosphate synthase small subunit [Alkalicoccobacillus murimartini]MDQ0207933.1 carbamoyl-phosphate synthase small subunit [Alkalicoccobacillus murimartini]